MPDKVLPEDAQRILGRDAQRNNILAARVVAETVKTTLGPKGMDKMLVDRTGNTIVTNDGVTILREMEIEHPAAKMIVEIAKTQESEVGDGTTTAVMLAGKFLENAEKLLDQKIHPTTIIRGYRFAESKAQEILKNISMEISSENQLKKIAETAMTGKGAEYLKEKFAQIVVEAVKIVADKNVPNIENIKIEKQKGASVSDTELINGIVINGEKISVEMPSQIRTAKIALIEEALEIKKLESEARISISSPQSFQDFLSKEDEILAQKVETIKNSGANIIFVQKGIDELVEYYLAKAGIFASARISKDDLANLSRATGAKIISRLSEISVGDLGSAALVEEKKHEDQSLIYLTGCKNPKALTILIRGGTEHVVDEIERAIRDALGDVSAVVKDPKVVAGGGAIEIELSKRLKEFSKTFRGRERLAVEQFAETLEFIPQTLAENAGIDPIDILTELRAAHDANNKHFGLNLFTGKIEDTFQQGIIEPLKVKTQAIASATEVATMILRIDDVIAAKKSGGSGKVSGMESYD